MRAEESVVGRLIKDVRDAFSDEINQGFRAEDENGMYAGEFSPLPGTKIKFHTRRGDFDPSPTRIELIDNTPGRTRIATLSEHYSLSGEREVIGQVAVEGYAGPQGDVMKRAEGMIRREITEKAKRVAK